MYCIPRRVTSVGNGDGELLCLVLCGRELFLRAGGGKQQEQCGLQEVVYVLYLHIFNGLNRLESKDGTNIELEINITPSAAYPSIIRICYPIPHCVALELRRRPKLMVIGEFVPTVDTPHPFIQSVGNISLVRPEEFIDV